MLTPSERIYNYYAQTGRDGDHVEKLTPRQRRRYYHKLGHQSLEAAVWRERATKARAKAREERKQRLAGLIVRR